MSTAAPIRATPGTHHRFHLLDALRAIAAVVVYWHARVYLPIHASHSGFLAVDFFFCLSGFVLAFAYERRLETTYTLRRFMVARVIRLYPIYLIGILLGLALALASSHYAAPLLLSSFAIQLAVLPSPLAPTAPPYLFPMDYPAWSIFFELLANGAYALLVRKALARTPNLLAIVGTFALALSTYLAVGHVLDAGPFWSRSFVCGLMRVVLSFTAGVVVLRLFRHRQTTPWTSRQSLLATPLLVIVLLILLLAPFSFQHNRTFPLLTIFAFFPALIYVSACCRLPHSWSAVCAFLGDASYPVYLLHAHVLVLLGTPLALHLATHHPGVTPFFVPVVVVLTGLLSYPLLKLYDTPMRSFLTRSYNTRPI